MKIRSNLLALLAVSALASTSASGALMITAIYDGQSGSPKGIELYVTTTGSYSGWELDIQSNTGTAWSTGYTFDSTTYTVGDFLYVTSTPTDPIITGAGGTIITDSSFNQNGNDRIRLTDGTITIDQIGATDVDGAGEAWEYTDSYAYRKDGTTASGGFVLDDWTYGGKDLLDSGNAPLAAVLGTYAIPEPTTSLLGALGLIALLRRRR